MLKWVALLSGVALIAAVLGLDGAGIGSATGLLFCMFLVMFVAVLLVGLLGPQTNDDDGRASWKKAPTRQNDAA